MQSRLADRIRDLHDLGVRAEECVTGIQTAFIYNRTELLTSYKREYEDVRKRERDLTEGLTELVANDPQKRPYVSVSIHLLRMWENLGKLCELVEKKINEGILFSDKAVHETTYLLQRLSETIRPAADMILARNTYLAGYVRESQEQVSKMASDYATLHEERLIVGECLPAASLLYVNMLDCMKSIAWHAREIAARLS